MAFETSLPLPAPVWVLDATWPIIDDDHVFGTQISVQDAGISVGSLDALSTSDRWLLNQSGGTIFARSDGVACIESGSATKGNMFRSPYMVGPLSGAALPAGYASPPVMRMWWLQQLVKWTDPGSFDAGRMGMYFVPWPNPTGLNAPTTMPPGGGDPHTMFGLEPRNIGGGVGAWTYRSWAVTTGAVLESVDTPHLSGEWSFIDVAVRSALSGVNGTLTVKVNGELIVTREFDTPILQTPDAQGGISIAWGNVSFTSTTPTLLHTGPWRLRQGAFSPSGEPLGS